jgi:hypothetical protein
MKKLASLFVTYILLFLQSRLLVLAHQSWCRLLCSNLPHFPVVALSSLLVRCTCVKLDFSVLFQPLEELQGVFIAFLFKKVNEHDLKVNAFAVLGEANVNLINELSVKSDIECIAHINFVVVSRNAWNADREHGSFVRLSTLGFSGQFYLVTKKEG